MSIGGIKMAENNLNHEQEARRSAGRSQGRRQAGSDSRVARRQKKKRPLVATVFLRIFQVLGTLVLIGVVTTAFLACYAAVYIRTAVLPNATLELSAFTLNENSVIYYYDENGQAQELETLVGLENQEWVDLEDIPQDLRNAVVAIEDHRFYEHNGVDWYRTAFAFVNMFLGMRNTFGGSTLTQQLIKNLTQYDDVTVTRKISEIFTALDVEKNYSKDDILELYLNVIYLGNGCRGVQAASNYYFGKDVSDLTLAECASLAGITNNPSLYSPNAQLNVTRYKCLECGTYSLTNDEPCDNEKCGAEHYGPAEVWNGREYNKARQELILERMADPEISAEGAYITQEQCEAAQAQTLVFTWDDAYTGDEDQEGTETEENSNVNSWYVDAVISELLDYFVNEQGMSSSAATRMIYSGGLRIYTPFDPSVQAKVDQIYENWDASRYISSTGQELASAITIVDNEYGYVVAMSGDLGEKEVNRGWNNAMATRQPGSSIKPLSVYAPALEMGLITPATVLDDSPVQLLNGNVWPLNLPRGYKGLTTVLEGVYRSVNTIATRTLQMVSLEASYQFLEERFGITSLEPGYYNNAGDWKTDLDYSPLAMGGLTHGVSTFEMAAAFATFPRGGNYTAPTTFLLVEDMDGNVVVDHNPSTTQVIKDTTAYYINSMLNTATTNVSGATATGARIPGQTIAGKTGTSDNSFNYWFAGYTTHYTAAVWSGYPQYDEIVNNQWGNPSVYLWREVMTLVHEGLPQEDFPNPGGQQAYSICMDCGNLAVADMCGADIRGSRIQTFYLFPGDAPTEYCTCHVPVTICTECPVLDENGEETGLYMLAGEHCPEESVKTVYMVDYVRDEVGSSVSVGDEYALMSIYEKLFPTEEERVCTVHDGRPYDPEDFDIFDPETWPTEQEWPGFDPEDETTWPNYEPPVDPSHPVEPSFPVEPSMPVEPTPDVEPEPSPVTTGPGI